MTRSTRLAPLESIRGFAAAYVLAGHICNVYLHNPAWALPFRFASEAVVLFFLLSGFVVRHATRDDTPTRDYFAKRVRRIYPLFVLSLAFSYGAACLHAGHLMPPLFADLLGNLFMLQDFGLVRPGVWFVQYYNDALWSLAYECWFYLFFIALIKWVGAPWQRNVAVCVAALLAIALHEVWPNQLGYFVMNFIIWWGAAEMARHHQATGRLPTRAVMGWCAALLMSAACWIPVLLDTPPTQRFLGLYPILDMRRFVAAASFLAIGALWFRCWAHGGHRLFQFTFGPFKALAPISYGIYIFHFPIINLMADSPLAGSPWLCVPATVACVLAVAWVTEIWLQKGWIDHWSIWHRGTPVTAARIARKARPA